MSTVTVTNSQNFTARKVAKAVPAREQSEGVGAKVRRSIGTMEVRNFTPFLMLDHFKVSPEAGFPDHPHRGQETITYMLEGSFDHEDFTGSKGTLNPGDLQFMTAGRGVVHAEMPHIEHDENGNIKNIEGLQLWVDLPKNLKNCEPRYRDLKAEEIPVANPNDKVSVKVISGQSYGVDSVKDLAYTPVWMLDFVVQPGGSVRQELPKDFNVFTYIMNGSIVVDSKKYPQYTNIFFETTGDGIEISVPETANEPARFSVIGGKALDQPIVQHGPFVETSNQKILQAFMDYQSSSNGFERAANWSSEIGKRMH